MSIVRGQSLRAKQDWPHTLPKPGKLAGIMPEEFMLPNRIGVGAAALRQSNADLFVSADSIPQTLRCTQSAENENPLNQPLWNPALRLAQAFRLIIEVDQQNQVAVAKPIHCRHVI